MQICLLKITLKWSKSEREREIFDIAYMQNLKWYKLTYWQNRNKLTNLENELKVTMVDRLWGGIVKEFGIDMYTLLYLRLITTKDLL